MRLNEGRRPDWHTKSDEPLLRRWQNLIANPYTGTGRESSNILRNYAGLGPHTGFRCIEAQPSMGPQVMLQAMVQVRDTRRLCQKT